MGPDPATPAAAPHGRDGELPPHFIELFKLAVEMADRVSARRATANSFFLAINAGLAALVGSQDLRWYVAVAGIVLSAAWWTLLKSYRDLNKAKFEVINAMEEQLPARVFSDEDDRLKATPAKPARRALRAWASKYREQGQVERVVPCVFALIYLAEIIRQAME